MQASVSDALIPQATPFVDGDSQSTRLVIENADDTAVRVVKPRRFATVSTAGTSVLEALDRAADEAVVIKALDGDDAEAAASVRDQLLLV